MTIQRLFARTEGRVTLLYGPDGLLRGTIVREIDGRHSLLIGNEAHILTARPHADAMVRRLGFVVV